MGLNVKALKFMGFEPSQNFNLMQSKLITANVNHKEFLSV